MPSPRFDITHFSLSRHGVPVLADVSFYVDPGEIVCLLGPSGGGKSSLLRCLNRLTEPPPQTIFLDDQDVTEMDVLALRRRVGMVFQQVALFPGTVADNVAYGPGLQAESLPPEEVSRLLALADLSAELAGRDSQELSGGQAQRVALARALATGPAAMLLDEPTSALDPAATRNVESTMLKLRQSLGLTVLWVTHAPEQARRVADRVYLLVDGRIVDEGTPEHLFRPGSQHLTAVFAAGELGEHES
ncbi:MAG: phosphate ABC transporter ATP-binding protein [Ardenticatenaceae bacterium]|nr:phosphate ABC transporter ATP-binding protein [Ardenticatenaceae bacterium]MCB8986883.1 phosphate ABC transporter ATP-binding protein [Ardenticatenaceae bacterium]